LSFETPPEWKAARTEEGYSLASDTHLGFILISPHQYQTLQQMEAEAKEGITDDETGVRLLPTSAFQAFGQNGLSGEFSGIYESQATRAFGICLLSPYGGGVSIIAVADSSNYGTLHTDAVKCIAQSVRFTRPQADRSLFLVLSGKYWSYSSGSSLSGSAGTERSIILYPNGLYKDSYEFSATGGSNDQYGNPDSRWGTDNRQTGAAQWKPRGNQNQGVIQVTYPNGETREISYQRINNIRDMRFDGIVYGFAGPAK